MVAAYLPRKSPELPYSNTENALDGELSLHCISDHHGCYDLPRAKDFLRSYVCSFYELLKKDYSDKITVWAWEQEIAEEAIQITLKCWSSFEVNPKAPDWYDTLRLAVVQHIGHPLRGQTQAHPTALVNPPPAVPLGTQASRYAAAEVDIASGSPLLIMVAAAAARAQQQMGAAQIPENASRTSTQAAPDLSEPARRENLLAEYKNATGNPSSKKIYEAHNSGIYKPEFYQWKKGVLPANSRTTTRFEAFLKSKKKPIPRNPTSRV